MSYDPANRDTIAVIATPFGQAGIGIVRLSGPKSIEIAERLFRPNRPVKTLKSHHLYLGKLIDPSSNEMIDEVLLSCMKCPNSYTREDVVEINSHSGHFLLAKILDIILEQGARLAEPGEFTFRAYINGRIDLTRAEAIMDIINAKSEKGLTLSAEQITGSLGDRINVLRDKVLDILAGVEVSIDYPEDDQGQIERKEAAGFLEKEVIMPVNEIISAHANRKIWLEGISTVIVGRVNAGKSSLLNRILNEQRSIVTPSPGTTRDIIESTLYIKGLPLRLADTAGIREGKGEAEKIGIQLSEKKFSEADLALIMIDTSRPLNKDDRRVLSMIKKEKSIIIINKIDLPSRLDVSELDEYTDEVPRVNISALTGEGVENLCDVIFDRIIEKDIDPGSDNLAPNLRHKQALTKAVQNLQNAMENLIKGAPMEIVSIDLNAALEHLGEITGETTCEDLYDRIFSRFCLGK